jgi:hypothetical protein
MRAPRMQAAQNTGGRIMKSTTMLVAMKGAEHQETLQSRELAKTFWAAADDANQTAREYRRQLPHNRVY